MSILFYKIYSCQYTGFAFSRFFSTIQFTRLHLRLLLWLCLCLRLITPTSTSLSVDRSVHIASSHWHRFLMQLKKGGISHIWSRKFEKNTVCHPELAKDLPDFEIEKILPIVRMTKKMALSILAEVRHQSYPSMKWENYWNSFHEETVLRSHSNAILKISRVIMWIDFSSSESIVSRSESRVWVMLPWRQSRGAIERVFFVPWEILYLLCCYSRNENPWRSLFCHPCKARISPIQIPLRSMTNKRYLSILTSSLDSPSHVHERRLRASENSISNSHASPTRASICSRMATIRSDGKKIRWTKKQSRRNTEKSVRISHPSAGTTMRSRIGPSEDTNADTIRDTGITLNIMDSDSQQRVIRTRYAERTVRASPDTTAMNNTL